MLKQNKLACFKPSKIINIERVRREADPIEQRTLRNVNNYLNINIYSYLETSGGQSSNLYLKVVHFFQCKF